MLQIWWWAAVVYTYVLLIWPLYIRVQAFVSVTLQFRRAFLSNFDCNDKMKSDADPTAYHTYQGVFPIQDCYLQIKESKHLLEVSCNVPSRSVVEYISTYIKKNRVNTRITFD